MYIRTSCIYNKHIEVISIDHPRGRSDCVIFLDKRKFTRFSITEDKRYVNVLCKSSSTPYEVSDSLHHRCLEAQSLALARLPEPRLFPLPQQQKLQPAPIRLTGLTAKLHIYIILAKLFSFFFHQTTKKAVCNTLCACCKLHNMSNIRIIHFQISFDIVLYNKYPVHIVELQE